MNPSPSVSTSTRPAPNRLPVSRARVNHSHSRQVIDDVKRLLCDPREVAARLNLEAKRCGTAVFVLCPMHGERSPSCHLRRSESGILTAHCFSCGFGSDVLGLIAAVRGLDTRAEFTAVIAEACLLAGLAPPEPRGRTDRRPRAPLPPLPPPPAPLPALDDDAFDALIGALKSLCPPAPDIEGYIASRAIADAASADGWFGLPPPAAQKPIVDALRSRFGDEAVAASGLVWRDANDAHRPWFGRFVHSGARVCIPWRTPRGSIQTLQRRALGDPGTFADGSARPKYVFARGRRPSHPYGAERVSSDDLPIVLVEGAVDTLAMRALAAQRGFACQVIGLAGVDGWAPGAVPLVRGRRVLVGLDAGASAEKAAHAVAAQVERAGGRPERLRPPEGIKDWGDMLVSRAAAVAAAVS